jgi:hypothetical protein
MESEMMYPPNVPPGPIHIYHPTSHQSEEELKHRRQTINDLKSLWKQVQIEYRAKYLGKWIAMANKKVVGVYDTKREAIINAHHEAKGEVYSAFEITPEDEIIL